MERLLKDFSIAFKEYVIRILDLNDINSLQNLCESCMDFFLLTEGKGPNIDSSKEIMEDLPPDKSYSDKAVLGVFNNENSLIAVMDIIRNFPADGEWILGLLLIHPLERGKGLGNKLHDIFKEIATQHQSKTLRLGVVEDNLKGYGFWKHLGYYEIDRVSRRYGEKDNIVIVMRNTLQCM